MTTEEILYDMIRPLTIRPHLVIGPETRFRNDLKMDSFDFLELILRTEERFRCRLDDGALAGIQTVGQFLTLVEETPAERDKDKTEEEHV